MTPEARLSVVMRHVKRDSIFCFQPSSHCVTQNQSETQASAKSDGQMFTFATSVASDGRHCHSVEVVRGGLLEVTWG